jgi:hypothetical protein
MRMSQKNTLGALCDALVRIRRKYGQQFDADIRGKRSATRANRKLTFGPRMSRADFLA